MTHRDVLIAFCAIAVLAIRSEAQNPVQPIFAACGTSNWVATERQVTVPARLLRDSAASPEGKLREGNPRIVFQFVVDTLGVPDTATVRMIPKEDAAVAERAKRDIGKWRYTPAIATGCKVRQVVTVTFPSGSG